MLRIILMLALIAFASASIGQTSAEPRGDMGRGCGASC